MFYRHMHAESCVLSREGEEAPKSELQSLRDERDRLALHLDAALDHAQQYNEGCLYCGEGEIIDGETTPEHQAECWWYRAKSALTPAGGGRNDGITEESTVL